jgi:hypothetical protein
MKTFRRFWLIVCQRIYAILHRNLNNLWVLYRNLKVGVLDDGKGVLPWRGPGESPEVGGVDPKLGV